jgi:PAS domain S-box-containing protein
MMNFSNGSNSQGREKRISQLLEEVPLGIISFNAEGIIDFVNPAFSRLGIIYHLKTSTLIGKNIFETEIIPGISLKNELKELLDGYPFEKETKN